MDENTGKYYENLPNHTGVYLMKDDQGRVIYVGKALNLRSRVRSYFREGADTRPGVVFLRRRIADVEIILTDTEKEAIILENTLIKKHHPRYNIDLRDDKDFLCLRITTKEKFPRLIQLRRPDNRDEPTFGPYASAGELKQTLSLIREIFPLRTCKPAVWGNRTRPCLNYQMGRCMGTCAGLVSEEEYLAMIENVRRFLKGSTGQVIKDLEKRMAMASDEMEFEKAARYRDQIEAINNTVERQKMIKYGGIDRDVMGLIRKGDRTVAARIRFREGKITGSNNYDHKTPGRTDTEVAGELLRRLYDGDTLVPKEILIDPEPDDRSAIEEWLSEKRGSRVIIRNPKRGEARQLVQLAEKNAVQALETSLKRDFDREAVAKELMKKLNLTHPPERIECVDISNIGGKQAVGSLASFADAMPDKSRYRRYRIKEVHEQDDYAMMLEVLRRRIKRGIEENNLPDLLMVDGGKGQLNVARAVLKELEAPDVPIAAIAKDRDGRGADRIFIPGRKNPVVLSGSAMHLLQHVRDEAHRFAVTYHRSLRKKQTLKSQLTQVTGIGPKKRDALLKHFGSLKKVKEANLEDLEKAGGIGPKDAENIRRFFNQLL